MIQNAIRTFFKISTQSATRAVRANVNVNRSCIICIHVVQEFLTRIKRWVEFVIFWSRKTFFDVEEVRRCSKLEQRLWILAAIEYCAENREQITRNKNPFKEAILVDKSCGNRESRRNNWESVLNPILDSQEDRESNVNFLLNGTVGYCYPVNPMIFIPYYKGRDYEM